MNSIMIIPRFIAKILGFYKKYGEEILWIIGIGLMISLALRGFEVI